MIKVGITGGHTRRAGELIRLLLNHPDVVVSAVRAPGPMFAGRPLSSLHRGLTGETPLTFSNGELPLDSLDVLFMTGNEIPDDLPEKLKVVNLTRTMLDGYVYGLPELNRKALVRGATRANIPSSVATAVVTPLLPLARNLMLNTPIETEVSVGEVDSTLFGLRDGEIKDALMSLQTSFDPRNLKVSVTPAPWQRATRVVTTVETSLDPLGAREMFDEFFNDHNLTYTVDRAPVADDVLGTPKCLIAIDRDDDRRLRLTSVIDGPLKGCASQGIHIMNLLMGLAERTGLSLPAFAF